METHRHFISVLLPVVVFSLLFITPSGANAYPFLDEAALERLKGKGDVILEVGAIPSPTPSRRQIIDADKGNACLECHHMPYPIAPQEPKKPGQVTLSSIKVTPPGGLRLLTSTKSPLNQVAGGWSPDTKHIIYAVNLFKDDWDIWVMDADGKNRRPLVSGSATEMAADWSPDGKTILYQSNPSGNNDIWTMDIATKKKSQCTNHPGQDTMPKWSPDGKKIVFQSNRSGNEDIWLKDILTGELTQLTKTPALDENPVFSPRGARSFLYPIAAGTRTSLL
jgi:dipeptidyl aminopeptidase/acylaminoacyl peptidase